jgi:CO dehydrogenase maturation factor
VDALIAVVEPGMRSVQTAARVRKLAGDIGIRTTFIVINKIRQAEQLETIRSALGEAKIIGTLPFSTELARADLEGRSVEVQDRAFAEALEGIAEALEKQLGESAVRE